MSSLTQQLRSRPELILPLGVLLMFLFVGNSAIDFHIHDTYIVVNGYSWPGLLLQLLLYSHILISWLLHQQLRKTGVPLYGWQRMQIIITFICLMLNIVLTHFTDQYHTTPTRYYDYNNWHSRVGPYVRQVILLLVIAILQLLFWIAAVILLIRKKRFTVL